MKLRTQNILFTVGCTLIASMFALTVSALDSTPLTFTSHTVTLDLICGDHSHRIESKFTGSLDELRTAITESEALKLTTAAHVRTILFDWGSHQAPPDDLMFLDPLGQSIAGPW